MKIEPLPDTEKNLGFLRWYLSAGVDELAGAEPINRLNLQPAPEKLPTEKLFTEKLPTEKISGQAAARPQAARPGGLVNPDELKAKAKALAKSCQTLAELEAAVRAFDGGALKQTAANSVFADGNPQSPFMFIDDIPGPDEDRQGKPLAGDNGRLMAKILGAIGLDRSQVYIASILFWRPPGGRQPTPQENAICLPFVQRHIELAAPRFLVLLGRAPANLLLGKTEPIARLRGKWTNYTYGATPSVTIPAIATYHPAHLLQHPHFKREAWQDFQEIQTRLAPLLDLLPRKAN